MSKLHNVPNKDSTSLASVAQVTHFLGVSEKTVRRRIADHSLPARRFGGQIRSRLADVEAYLTANQVD